MQVSYSVGRKKITFIEILEQFNTNEFRYLVLKLYFYEFFKIEEDFERLRKYTQKPAHVLFEQLDQLEELLNLKKKRKLESEAKLTNYYLRHHKQQALSRQTAALTFEQALEIENKAVERKKHLLAEYNSITIETPIKAISDLLLVKPNKVSNVINYFKTIMRKNYSN